MASTINILLKIKQAGEEVLKEAAADLKKLQESAADIKSAPVVVLREELEKISEVAKSAAGDIAKIKDVVVSTIDEAMDQARDRVIGATEQASERAIAVVEIAMARIIAIVGGGVLFQKIIGLGAITKLIKGDLSGITQGIAQAGIFINGIASTITTKIVGDVNSLFIYTGYFEGFLSTLVGVFRVLSFSTLLLPFALQQTWFFLRRITGQASSALTPMQHASNLMVSINSSLNSAYITLYSVLVPFVGTTLMWLLFGSSGLFVAIPMALNGIISLVTGGLNFLKMFIFRHIGIGRGALFMMFRDVRKFILELHPYLVLVSQMLKAFAPQIKAVSRPMLGMFSIFGRGRLKSFEDLITKIKEVAKSFLNLPKSVEAVRLAIKELGKEIQVISAKQFRVRIAMPTRQAVSPTAPASGKNLFRRMVEDIKTGATQAKAEMSPLEKQVAELFSFEKLLARTKAKGDTISSRTRAYMVAFIRSAFDTSLLKESKPEHFQKVFATFMKEAFGFTGKISVPKDAIQKVSKALYTMLATAAESGVKPGKDFGSSIMRALTASMKKDAPEALKTATKTALEGVQNILLQSVAKSRGSGKEIGKQIAKGMTDAKKEIGDSARANAQEVADHNPSSPAKKGPLRRLITMGYLIGSQLSVGMLSAKPLIAAAALKLSLSVTSKFVGIAKSIASQMAAVAGAIQGGMQSISSFVRGISQKIRGDVEKAADMSLLAERIGIPIAKLSALDYAFQTVGSSAEEFSFAFMRINETLGKSLAGEEAEKFERLGISLDKIRGTNEPTLAFLLEMSDVIKDLPEDSEKFRIALELMGVTAHSKIVNVLRLGREEIIKLAKEGVNLGAVIDESMGKVARQMKALDAKFAAIKTRFLDELYKVILPEIVKAGNKLLEIIERNRSKIQTVIKIAGEGLIIVKDAVVDFVRMLLTEPSKAWDVLKGFVGSIAKWMLDSVSSFFKNTRSQIFSAVIAMGDALLYLTVKIGMKIFDALVKLGESKLPEILRAAWKSAGDAMKNFFEPDLEEQRKALRAQIDNMGEEIGRAEQLLEQQKAGTLPWYKFLEEIDEEALDKYVKARQKLIIKEAEIIKKMQPEPISVDIEIGDISDAKLKEKLGKVEDAIGKLGGAIVSEEHVEEQRQNLEEMAQNLADAVKGTELESHMQRLAELFSAEHFQTTKEGIENAAQATVEAIDKIDKKATISVEKVETWLDRLAAWWKENEKTFGQMGETFSNFGQMFSTLYEMSGKKLKEFFVAFKAMSISETIINTAKGVMGALSTPPVGPWNYAQAASIAAMGTVQVAKIVAETVSGFLGGGFVGQVPGPATGKDHKLIAVDGEEFVVPGHAVRKLMAQYGRGFMDNLQRGLVQQDITSAITVRPVPVPGFLNGGPVGQMAPSAAVAPVINMPPIINVLDNSVLARMLASQDGKRALWNIMANNSAYYRDALSR